MHINWKLRKLNLKIVYYGPAMSGKTTNLEQIHKSVNPQHRGELVSLNTHEDRTLFFDFLQLELGQINGLTPQIHLYTVPGQTYYASSRRVVLRGADGAVFVADSAANRLMDNLRSWRDMQDHIASFGISLAAFPLVMQFNKQDLPGALTPSVLRNFMHADGCTMQTAAAIKGIGVFNTLKIITRKVIKNVQQELVG